MTPEQADALLNLLDENIALFQRMRYSAEQLHQQGECSGALRSLLRNLANQGPQTVPVMARQRAMARQPLQTMINQLLEQGLIVQQDNPAHKRSPLYALTASGQAVVQQMQQREQTLLAQLDLTESAESLQSSCLILRAVRRLFEGWCDKKRDNQGRS